MPVNRGAKVVKGYVIVNADGREQPIRAVNREGARRHARQFARTHDADFKLIELREGRPTFVVDIYRRQARESG
jgi:hypothetical protein